MIHTLGDLLYSHRDKARAMLADAIALAAADVAGGPALVGSVAADVESAVHRQVMNHWLWASFSS